MLETCFSASKMLVHLPSGPGGPYLDGFAAALGRQGYSAGTAVRFLRAAAHIGHVVDRQGSMPATSILRCSASTYLARRPSACPSDYVVLRNIAPFRPFRSGDGVSSVVRRLMQRSGVVAPVKGAHVLRHTAATEMLRMAFRSRRSGWSCGIEASTRRLVTPSPMSRS